MYYDTSREKFNNEWKFLSPADFIAEINTLVIPPNACKVDLPHAWNAIGWNYENYEPAEPAGTAWYFKRLPKLDISKNLSLKFEGIAAKSEVYINGKLAHLNLGAYTAFEVPLKGITGNGSDLVAIKVTDKSSVELLDECDDPFSASSRYEHWALPMGSSMTAGGIWRNVWLIEYDKVKIQTPHVISNMKFLLVSCTVEGVLDDVSLEYTLYDENGETVVNVNALIDEQIELSVNDAKIWSPSSPVLYRLETKLFKNNLLVQTISQPVAFYDFSIHDSEFYFNDRPYFLRGQNGFPHCNVPYDQEYMSRYVKRVKEQGVEISRFHTEPPTHAWLNECDRQGVMVILELPLHGSIGCYPLGSPEFQKTYLQELRSLIEEYRRHPSIVMWCLGNEIIVSSERDIGLAEPLFDLLEEWADEVRKLDPRPVIANSGGDGAEMVHRTVGDVDDVHQYGGWYVENLFDLHNYEQFIAKNDMLFQPMICTESVAAYTDNQGYFFAKHNADVRQRKVIRQRLGNPNFITPEECMELQAFILQEYAEAMWRMRRGDTRLAGYIPFGQYTWFLNPFDKGPDGLKDKPVWKTYREVMSPVHVQLECWNRHVVKDDKLSANLILNHEDISLPDEIEIKIVVSSSDSELYVYNDIVKYHSRIVKKIQLDISMLPVGKHDLYVQAFYESKLIARNNRTIKIYPLANVVSEKNIWIYDPIGKLDCIRTELKDVIWLDSLNEMDFADDMGLLVIAPYAMNSQVKFFETSIHQWCIKGNGCIVMEQNPDKYTKDILKTSIDIKRSTQPYWSRWAQNMVRHADRADICVQNHPVFEDLDRYDMSRWNGDTYLAHSYFRINSNLKEAKILSGIAHGLADDELMPVEHSHVELDYNPIVIENSCGRGKILLSNLLIGDKLACEPIARKLFSNMLKYMTMFNG